MKMVVDYRPQWVNPTPQGFREETFFYFFDKSNVPGFAVQLAAGLTQENIPLALEVGSEFLWRGYAIYGFCNTGFDGPVLVRFKDPYGNYLSDGYVPVDLYGYPSGMAGFMPSFIPLEPEIVCPSGGLVTIDLQNAGSAPHTVRYMAVVLLGLRRVRRAQ